MMIVSVQVEETKVSAVSIGVDADEGWLVVEDAEIANAMAMDPFHWLYIDGKFVKEDPEVTRKREEAEREEYERTRPKTTEEKVDELTAITDDMILLMAELIGG